MILLKINLCLPAGFHHNGQAAFGHCEHFWLNDDRFTG